MIKSFANRDTERLFKRERPRGIPGEIQERALRKLAMIAAAAELSDLRSPPGNRLEALRGRRLGQWSIRINDQWRVCFGWEGGDAIDVEIVDYHD